MVAGSVIKNVPFREEEKFIAQLKYSGLTHEQILEKTGREIDHEYVSKVLRGVSDKIQELSGRGYLSGEILAFLEIYDAQDH